jgi:hypothetical protein
MADRKRREDEQDDERDAQEEEAQEEAQEEGVACDEGHPMPGLLIATCGECDGQVAYVPVGYVTQLQQENEQLTAALGKAREALNPSEGGDGEDG